ncbi:MAG: hypothetical protein DRI65_07860 [Chloroflexota bacterium]|nr:MAG: hypothetical protein DRI65_07860 [Chloroflexota bacterium]
MYAGRIFYPPKQMGTIIHLLLMLLFSAAGAWGIWGVSNVEIAPQLLPYIALIILFLATVPYLIYRLYALHRSEYILERGGIKLNWGWRSESLPMEQVDWVYRLEDLEAAPHLPIIHWPGAVTGVRRFQRGPEVEYLASRSKGLVIIAAGERYYAVSPIQANEFISTYNELTELGAISFLETESVRPALILTDIVKIKPILWILISGGLLNISLLIWTLLVIPSRDLVSLGFTSGGLPHEGLDSVRLVLFPILNTTAYLANLVLGLFLFRNQENRFLAYLLWTGSLLVAILFHIGMLFILT